MVRHGRKKALGSSVRRSRAGFLLYIVVSLLLVCAIFVFSLSTFKSGAVEQLTQTADQTQLMVLAQTGIQEMIAQVKFQANRPGPGHSIHKDLREVFSKINPLGMGTGMWTKTVAFPPAMLPETNALSTVVRGAGVRVEGKMVLVVTDQSNTYPTSYLGNLEFYSRAIPLRNPKRVVEIKETREIRLANMTNFLDKYALFVKTYLPDWNNRSRKIRIEGIQAGAAKNSVYSYAFLGNRFYPPCEESFPPEGPPVLMDIDFQEDQKLLQGFAQSNPTFAFTKLQDFAFDGQGCLFYVLPTPIAFNKLCAGKDETPSPKPFQASDFYQVPMLHKFYVTLMDRVKAGTGAVETGAARPILEDYERNKGNLANSEGFKNLVETCIRVWEYTFGYTDFNHLVNRDGTFTKLAESPPFVGIKAYFDSYKRIGTPGGKPYNKARPEGGTMPAFFGANRETPVMIEGNVYARFFKLAFFNGVDTKFPIYGGTEAALELPPLPIHFRRPGETPITFENKKILTGISRIEKYTMSRAVEEIPLSRFFFPTITEPRVMPEQAGTKTPPEKIFPSHDPKMTSHQFFSGRDLLALRIFRDASGRNVLDIDGLMVLSEGDLDLTGVHFFRGKGQILVVKGDCKIGQFERMDPDSGDTVQIYLNEGSFSVESPDPKVKIVASLAALMANPSESQQGAFKANRKGVHILGNLIVDLLPITDGTFGIGQDQELLIEHDPRLFSQEDPCRISIGPVSINFAVNSGEPTWQF